MCVYIYIHIFMQMEIFVHVCIHMCRFLCKYVYMYMYIYICSYTIYKWLYIYAHTYMYIYTYIHTYAYSHVCTPTYKYVCMYARCLCPPMNKHMFVFTKYIVSVCEHVRVGEFMFLCVYVRGYACTYVYETGSVFVCFFWWCEREGDKAWERVSISSHIIWTQQSSSHCQCLLAHSSMGLRACFVRFVASISLESMCKHSRRCWAAITRLRPV